MSTTKSRTAEPLASAERPSNPSSTFRWLSSKWPVRYKPQLSLSLHLSGVRIPFKWMKVTLWLSSKQSSNSCATCQSRVKPSRQRLPSATTASGSTRPSQGRPVVVWLNGLCTSCAIVMSSKPRMTAGKEFPQVQFSV